MPDWAAYEEASKRGILPEDKAILYQEAKSRGLVPGFKPEMNKPSLIQSIGQGAYRTAQNIGQVYPAVETGLNLLTSMYGVPLSGLAGLAGLPFGKGPEAVKAVQEATIYQPQTQRGQELTGATNYPLQKLGEIEKPITEAITEAYGPELGTAVGTAIEASPLLFGLKGGKTKIPTPRELSKSRMIKEGFPVSKDTLIERIGERIPPGSRFAKKQREVLNEMLIKADKQFIVEKAGLPDPSSMPKNKVLVKETFNQLEETIGGKEQIIDIPNLTKFIDEKLTPDSVELMGTDSHGIIRIIQHDIEKNSPYPYIGVDKVKLKDLNYTDRQIEKLENSPITAHSLVEAKIPSKNVSVRRDGQVIIFNEADKARFIAVPLQRTSIGKTTYDLVNKLNASLKGGKDLNKINLIGEIRQAIRDDFNSLQESTGKPVFDLYEKAMEISGSAYKIRESMYLEKIFRQAIKENPETGTKVFNPIKFREEVTKQQSITEEIFKRNPEIPQMLDSLADDFLVTGRQQKMFAKESMGMGPLMERMNRYITAGGSIGGLGYLSHLSPEMGVLIAVPWGFEIAMAYSLAHPRRWLRKWMERDKSSKLPGSLKVGMGIAGATETGQFRNRPYITVRGQGQTEPEVEY